MSKKSISVELLVNGNVESFINFYKTFSENLQAETLQQLLINLERSVSDSEILSSSTRLADFYSLLDYHEYATKYYQLGLVASRKLHYSFEIDANLNLGREYSKAKRLEIALDYFMKARDLSILKEDTVRERIIFSDVLKTNYDIAKLSEDKQDYHSAVKCYKNLLEMIKKFDSELESSEAMKLYLKLGNSNEKLGLVGVATEYLETFLAKCSDNEPGKGHARILLADCYERHDDAMKILESYIATANEGDEGNVAVYEILGKLYSNEGKFDLAVQNYQRHYKALAENPSDKDALRSAMVNLGIATANSKMNAYFKAVVDPKCIDGLLTWKASRSLEGL